MAASARALLLGVILLSLFFLSVSGAGKLVTAGDNAGWTHRNDFTGSGEAPDYSSWAAGVKLQPGHAIEFVFLPGSHNVHLFNDKVHFDSCNFTSSKILSNGIIGVYTWIAPGPGTYYFGCNMGSNSHCHLGQKFGIDVTEINSSGTEIAITKAPSPEQVSSNEDHCLKSGDSEECPEVTAAAPSPLPPASQFSSQAALVVVVVPVTPASVSNSNHNRALKLAAAFVVFFIILATILVIPLCSK